MVTPQLLSYVLETSQNEAVDQHLHIREQVKGILKENLLVAQSRMKLYSNKKRLERQFEVGEWEYLCLSLIGKSH